MKMHCRQILIFLVAAAALWNLAGCGVGDQPVIKASNQEVSDIKKIRAIFDKVHGDYSQLSDADKKVWLDYEKGDENKVKAAWNQMLHPQGGPGGANASRPFSTGPGGGVYPPGQGSGQG